MKAHDRMEYEGMVALLDLRCSIATMLAHPQPSRDEVAKSLKKRTFKDQSRRPLHASRSYRHCFLIDL
jgi:hypothetical protein